MIGIGEMELKTTGYASVAVTLDEMTPGAVQAVLQQAYNTLDADPKYLFLSHEDYKVLDDFVSLGRCACFGGRMPHTFPLLNQTTDTIMWVVPLTGLEPHTIVVGFLDMMKKEREVSHIQKVSEI